MDTFLYGYTEFITKYKYMYVIHSYYSGVQWWGDQSDFVIAMDVGDNYSSSASTFYSSSTGTFYSSSTSTFYSAVQPSLLKNTWVIG